ncbi:conditioned medium factor [Wenzhouxiangella sp. XN79A]|nr:conditioned medium factor [Wenzhouxiangella sp. XN79A]
MPLAALISCGLAVAQGSAPVPKQLAGPPSEFREMQLPAPEDAAVLSTSALLPVKLSPGRDGWSWQGRVAIDGADPRMVLFTGGDDAWHLQTAAPGRAQLADASVAASELADGTLGLNNERHAGAGFRFEGAPAGEWSVRVQADNPVHTEGLLLVGSDSPWTQASWPAARNHRVGETLAFVTELRHATDADARARIREASMAVTGPGGATRTFNLAGQAEDALSAQRFDGNTLSGAFTADRAGPYTVRITVRGATPEGTPFVRSTQHALVVVDNDLVATREPLGVAEAVDDTRLAIDLGVSSRRADGFYRAYAEVWGTIGKADVPVAWIGGMVPAGQPRLHLDARWIALSGASAPFELRNVRIENADHFVPLVQHARMPLDLGELPRSASELPHEIDEAMRMGPRPARSSGQRAGARLMLVHGYCSGDAWGPVQSQFTSSVKFQDFNQNRSHNDFALRIRAFGDQFDSFGIVAHSQGGAAATHLYTYYWSGLDDASGSRLIQSVGTPYQGTSLAGNLAAIGDVFGVGCGTNTDLTYSGASSWLAGIPSWARSRVNYYTTSFATAWWRWDYCNIGSDLLLSDPEDGTTERARGQLSGAYNRGHKTGWCHTEGMRDPPQVRDASRNSVMNSSAAR